MKNSKIYPWVVVGLLWFVALLNYMDRQILSTMRPAMAMDIKSLESATVFGNLMIYTPKLRFLFLNLETRN